MIGFHANTSEAPECNRARKLRDRANQIEVRPGRTSAWIYPDEEVVAEHKKPDSNGKPFLYPELEDHFSIRARLANHRVQSLDLTFRDEFPFDGATPPKCSKARTWPPIQLSRSWLD